MTDNCEVPPGFKIVSGGQTGADRAALDWAIANGVPHGGWCPKGRKSEDGPINVRYNLTETPSSNYLERTEWNVRDSDATLIFSASEKLDGGSKRTAEFADRHHKPWMHCCPRIHPKYITKFLTKHQVKVLNIAGKRESSAPGIGKIVADALDQVLIPL